MTWEIVFVFALLAAMLASFAWELIPTELTALCGLALLLATGILPTEDALEVFGNAAPITVGAMFIISVALEKSGAIQSVAGAMQSIPGLRMRVALPVMMLCVAVISAFINNTPVVVVFLPVVLSLAKRLNAPASKLLIPLSYASILGGSCTLIGTSTNIVVSSIAESRGVGTISMFELAWVGVPMMLAGIAYIVLVGYRLLPRRDTVSTILSEEDRREYILEAFVNEGSPLVGKRISEIGQFRATGLRALEVIRHGVAVRRDAAEIELMEGDRLLVSASAQALARAQATSERTLEALLEDLGLEQIAAMEGSFVEAAIRSGSSLSGYTTAELNFRQRYRLTLVAIHRRGRNLRAEIATTRLQNGDILLLLGSKDAIENLRSETEFVVIDETRLEARPRPINLVVTLGVIAGLIGASAAGIMPIAGAAIIGCVVLLATRCLSMNEAYRAIHWPILFLIFAMLGVGRAMETSGASAYLASSLVNGISGIVDEAGRPLALLAGVYLITSALTEILSNNAAAALMATLAIGIAQTLDVDAKPFIIAVAMGASASFATPIGYQTNTYVYGIGGYHFADFLKVGGILNVVAFFVTVSIIPFVWPF